MSYAVFSDSTARRCMYFAFLLCCAFISGFLAGAFLAVGNASNYSPLIHKVVATVPSAIGPFGQITVWFSLTALISMAKKGHLFLVLCFLQAFTFGVMATAVYYSYGSASWLIQALMLFTRTVTLISLLWFWFRNIFGQICNAKRDFLLALCLSVLAAAFDLFLVSPFMLSLFF